MLKFLRRNQQAFIFITFLYGTIAVLTSYFTHPHNQYISSPFKMPFLSGLSTSFLNQNTYWLFTILVAAILIFIGFYFTRVVIKFLIISSRSQFPAIFFLSISSLAISKAPFSGAIIACFLMLFCIERLFESVDQKGLSFRFLDSGIILGLASLFYFNIIFLFPFFILAQITLRPLNWRELLHIFLGMFFPFVYIFSIWFIQGISISDTWNQIMEWVLLKKTIVTNWYFLGALGFYLLILLISSLIALQRFTVTKILIRKYYQLLLFLFLNLLSIAIFIPSAGIEMLYLFAVPASIPYSIYFTHCRSNFINKVFLLLILAIPIALNFFY